MNIPPSPTEISKEPPVAPAPNGESADAIQATTTTPGPAPADEFRPAFDPHSLIPLTKAATKNTAPEIPAAPKQRRLFSRFVGGCADWSENLRKLLLNSIVVTLLILLGWSAYRELRQKTLVINPIEVPRDLSDRGHSSTVLALRLNDGIQEVLNGGTNYLSSSEIAPLKLQPDNERPDIDVPGGNLSLRTIIRYARYAFNLPEQRVGGSISKEGEQLCLLLRQDNHPAKLLRASTLDELVTMGAEEVVMARSPLLAAGYFLDNPDHDKDFVKTEAALNEVLKSDTNRAIVYYMFGEMFRKRKQLEQASTNYERATLIDPSDPAYFNNWGNALSQMGKHTEAIEKYKKATTLMTNPSIPLRNWCASLVELQKPEDALSKCEEAVTHQSNYAQAYYSWGRALYALERYDEALPKYQKAAELDPKAGHSFRGWAMALLNLGKFDEAIEKYRKAVELNSNDVDAVLGWGMALDNLHKYPEAIEKFKRAIEINPKYSYVYERWAYVLSQLGRKREARAMEAKAREMKSE